MNGWGVGLDPILQHRNTLYFAKALTTLCSKFRHYVMGLFFTIWRSAFSTRTQHGTGPSYEQSRDGHSSNCSSGALKQKPYLTELETIEGGQKDVSSMEGTIKKKPYLVS